MGIRSIRHHNKHATTKLATTESHRWRFDFFVLCSLLYETYVKIKAKMYSYIAKKEGDSEVMCSLSIMER